MPLPDLITIAWLTLGCGFVAHGWWEFRAHRRLGLGIALGMIGVSVIAMVLIPVV